MDEKETNTEIKKWQWVALGLIALCFIVYKMYGIFYWPKVTVKIGGEEFQALVADNDRHRLEGWSGKKDMGRFGGMLFLYYEDADHVMVMRDMNFPLDIVWLNDGRVVDIAPNASPEKKGVAEEKLMPYFGRAKSDMVLEVPADFTKRTGLKIGDVIEVRD